MTEATPPFGSARIVAADEAAVALAAERLAAGRLVALPTETVYGLAARADDAAAIAGVFAAKGRPSHNPLIVHVTDAGAAARLGHIDDRAKRLMARFWPGPLTLVVPCRADAPLAGAVTAGLPTVALRSPDHPVMRAVLARCDFALAAPSANRSGAVSPTCAAHVAQSLHDRDVLILDGGTCERGLESTIVAVRDSGWEILRPGPVSAEAIERACEEPEMAGQARGIEAPGQMASHYAPGKPVRLEADNAGPDEFHIGFGSVGGDWSLSASGDLAEAASRLYEALHRAAQSEKSRIAVAPVPQLGLGRAINDRLRRAAA